MHVRTVKCTLDDIWFLRFRCLSVMVPVYSGPFPAGFVLYLEMMCVFLVGAILERLCHGDRCSVFFALDLHFLLSVAMLAHASITRLLGNVKC